MPSSIVTYHIHRNLPKAKQNQFLKKKNKIKIRLNWIIFKWDLELLFEIIKMNSCFGQCGHRFAPDRTGRSLTIPDRLSTGDNERQQQQQQPSTTASARQRQHS